LAALAHDEALAVRTSVAGNSYSSLELLSLVAAASLDEGEVEARTTVRQPRAKKAVKKKSTKAGRRTTN